MIGCVGNGDGVMVTGINVDVGTNVGEITVGMDVSGGRATVCFPQADKVTNKITVNKSFIERRLGFMEKDKFCKS
jgi:hypothetical protein